MSLYASLRDGDSLLDSDEASRYCRPGNYDRHRSEPKVGAFQKKSYESDISINRLQFHQLPDRDSAVGCIRREFQNNDYGLEPHGRFVVFNVGAARVAARDVGHDINFTYAPEETYPSHSSIYPPEDPQGALAVATAIKRLITKVDIYPALL